MQQMGSSRTGEEKHVLREMNTLSRMKDKRSVFIPSMNEVSILRIHKKKRTNLSYHFFRSHVQLSIGVLSLHCGHS
jgi:hypothetical protein